VPTDLYGGAATGSQFDETFNDVLGYAPMYNGTYSNFSNDKCQISYSIADDDVVDLGQDFDEWNAGSCRSWCQRPVVRVCDIIAQIISETNSGYKVSIDPKFANAKNPW